MQRALIHDSLLIVDCPGSPDKNATTSRFFVIFTVKISYSQVDFDMVRQEKFKTAVANAAGTSICDILILSIVPIAGPFDERRGTGSVEVETKVATHTWLPMLSEYNWHGNGDVAMMQTVRLYDQEAGVTIQDSRLYAVCLH